LERTTTTEPRRTRIVARDALPVVAAALTLAAVAPTAAQAEPVETVRAQVVLAAAGDAMVCSWTAGRASTY
jgi:hypothetical protein